MNQPTRIQFRYWSIVNTTDNLTHNGALFEDTPKMSEELDIDLWLEGISANYIVRLDAGDAACWFLIPKPNQERYRRGYRIAWSSVIQSALFLLKLKQMGAK